MPNQTVKPKPNKSGFFTPKLSAYSDVSSTLAKAGLRTLRGVQKLLSKPGVWIQDAYEHTNKNGEGEYCLIGANQHVDGPGEDLSHEILINLIKGERTIEVDELPSKYRTKEENKEIKENLSKYPKGVKFVSEYEDFSLVEEWNDKPNRTFTDVMKLLKQAVGFAERLVASRKSKNNRSSK